MSDGTTYTYTTTGTASSYQAEEIVDQLVTAIGSPSGFTITDLGTNIYISKSTDFTIELMMVTVVKRHKL